jgi:hypothetical protein
MTENSLRTFRVHEWKLLVRQLVGHLHVKVINSVKHNTYIVIKTQLATCFGSSEPSSGRYLIYGHGAFSECVYYEIPYCLKTTVCFKIQV